MSDAHNEHESVIKTPKQLIAAVVAGFLVPIICIVLLVVYVASGEKVGAGSEGMSSEAIAARLMPVADAGFTLKDVNAVKVLQAGDAVYKATCSACHDSGAAGAPKFGDAGQWAPRIAQGQEKLVANALKGVRAMPAKGGNPDLDDVEVERAVVYMANKAGGNLKEPAVKAAAAAAPAASEAAPAAAAAPAVDGKKVFETTCAACHGTGIAGAPKFGDKDAWAPRIKQGVAKLHENAIKGFQGKAGVMPPKGGSTASDEDVKAAVDYMVAGSK
jgi:cytochrome c5